MTATKKSIRFLTVITLVLAMVFSIASVPTSAAGVETWYKSDNYIMEDAFTIRGYNLTPVKTMGDSGTLYLVVGIRKISDSNSNPVNFKYEIRSTNGTVLLSESIPFTNDNGSFAFWNKIQVTAGQKIQVYISTYDTVTGAYRTCEVEYWHWLS